MEEGKHGPYEYHLIMKDGSLIPFEVTSGVLRSTDGTPRSLVHVCRDITLRQQNEQEKKSLQERLSQAQKMESIGRLAGGVAHDFNNMLGVILGHTELVMEMTDPEQPIHSHLREVRKAAERSANLTRQLLAFARKQTVTPIEIDINETVGGMIKMLQRLIGEDIHLSWQPCVNPWKIKIDPSQIDQILANMCVNARDAIAGVGRVSIESGNISINDDFCTDRPDCIPETMSSLS
jgi:C4-dicarboxylate-specific signal transduction histidine kinase